MPRRPSVFDSDSERLSFERLGAEQTARFEARGQAAPVCSREVFLVQALDGLGRGSVRSRDVRRMVAEALARWKEQAPLVPSGSGGQGAAKEVSKNRPASPAKARDGTASASRSRAGRAPAPKKPLPAGADKVRKLARIAAELRQGKRFEITRLTLLKSLCKDPAAAGRFVVHLSRLNRDRMRARDCPSHLSADKWRRFQKLVKEAVRWMESYLQRPGKKPRSAMQRLLSEAQDMQNQYKDLRWTTVRIIECREALIVEKSLKCLLYPHDSAVLCYQIARDHAERYSPHHGTGLTPESAPLVEDIADFWCRRLLGVSLEDWAGPQGLHSPHTSDLN
jgi:hypothetical protein